MKVRRARWRRTPRWILRWYVRVLYRWSLRTYEADLRRFWQVGNPQMAGVIARFPEAAQWVALWGLAREYVRTGGRSRWRATTDWEDVLLCDLAARDSSTGPVKEAIESTGSLGQAALAAAAVPGTAAWRRFERIAARAMTKQHRLGGLAEAADLTQDLHVMAAQAAREPVGNYWGLKANKDYSPALSDLGTTENAAADILGRVAAIKYGANRSTEGRAGPLSTLPSEPEEPHDPYEGVEARALVQSLMQGLPPLQRQAVDTKLQSDRAGVTLEAMARRLGRDPAQEHENYKAAIRNLRGKAARTE